MSGHLYTIDPSGIEELRDSLTQVRAVAGQDPPRVVLVVGHDIHPDEVPTILECFSSCGVRPDVFQVHDDDELGIIGSGWEETEELLHHWSSSGAWRRLTPTERAKKRNDVWPYGIDWPVRWILDPKRANEYALIVSAYVPVCGANLRWAMYCFIHGGATAFEWEQPKQINFLCFALEEIEDAIFAMSI